MTNEQPKKEKKKRLYSRKTLLKEIGTPQKWPLIS